jgi:rhamnosyltransferase
MPKVLAIVVSYFPEKDLVENVRHLLTQVDHIIIVDNKTSIVSQELLSSLSDTRITTIYNTDNLGVGKGFNQGIEWGVKNGYDFFLLMDQDSRVQKGMVNTLLETVIEWQNRSKFVIVGPEHQDFRTVQVAKAQQTVEEVPLLITSGSLLSREVIKKFGLYDERLFIDHVDHDYCLRVVRGGGRCLKVHSALLLHRFGKAEIKRLLGKSFFLQEYSPFRRYFMMRNRIILYKRYGMLREAWFWLDLRSAVKDLVKLVFFESERGAKLKAVFRGIADGLRWKESQDSKTSMTTSLHD